MIRIDQATQGGNFVNPQWIINRFPNNTTLAIDKWCLVLSGVVIINFTGPQSSDWRRDAVQIVPDISGPFAYAGVDYNQMVLQVEQYVTYGSLNSIFDQDTSVNAGFAVDNFYPFFSLGGRAFGLGSGINLDVAVRDDDAILLRVGYYLMAIGTFVTPPPIL